MQNFRMFWFYHFIIFGVMCGKSAFLFAHEPSSTSQFVFPIETPLDGPKSIYTDYLLNLLSSWPHTAAKSEVSAKDPNPVQLQCLETPGNPFYIGLRQIMIVDAPLSRVAAVLDDIDHYKEIFPGYDDIHVVSRDRNRILTTWEQHIPIFFVPNIRYQLSYIVDSSSNRRIYRYQLKDGDHLKSNDGMIVIEAIPSKLPAHPQTLYKEYDFIDADWGVLKSIAPEKIWKATVEGIYLSDLGIKLKAENNNWPSEEIISKSQKLLNQYPVDSAIENKGKP